MKDFLSGMRKFKIGVCQLKQYPDKMKNLLQTEKFLEEAIYNGAKMCFLPNCFNSFLEKNFFCKAAESFNDPIRKTPTLNLLKHISKKYGVFIIGSIPEKIKNKNVLYNTALITNPDGEIISKYRKMHMFEIDFPGKLMINEKEVFQPGNEVITTQTRLCKLSIGIGVDIRIPEFSLLMAQENTELINFIGGFNTITGPLHWETLIRTRAVDNQAYVGKFFLKNILVGCASARYIEDPLSYQSYGHSMVIDPLGKYILLFLGKIVASTHADPEILYADIDLDNIKKVKGYFEYEKQKRFDIYEVKKIEKKERNFIVKWFLK